MPRKREHHEHAESASDLRPGDGGLRGGEPALSGALRAGQGLAAWWRTDELDDEVGRGLPALRGVRRGLDYHRCGRTRLRRFLPRGHRRDDRTRILIFNWCYHGSVDETFATLRDGRVVAREGNVGPPVDPGRTTRVVEFNDV